MKPETENKNKPNPSKQTQIWGYTDMTSVYFKLKQDIINNVLNSLHWRQYAMHKKT